MSQDFPIYEKEVLERQATHLIGTLGNVAEGKSTLIRALTGVKTQRYATEQVRDITIHLGYANAKVYQNDITGEVIAKKTSEPAPPSHTLIGHLSFVDCPGHEAFLATMLSGASIMDTALLIISADSPGIPQKQTAEHLVAAEMMGLERFLVLHNKLDIVSKEKQVETRNQISLFLKGTAAEMAPVYPISAQLGWNVEHVLDKIVAMKPPTRNLNKPMEMMCVRSFDVNKPQKWEAGVTVLHGAVIGGTVLDGVLVKGDWIEMRPGILHKSQETGEITAQPLFAQVQRIRCEDAELPYAIPGSLMAIETNLDPCLSIANGLAGQRIGEPGSLPPIQGEIVVKCRFFNRTDGTVFQPAQAREKVYVSSNVRTTSGVIMEVLSADKRRIALDSPLCLGVGEQVSIRRHNNMKDNDMLECVGEVIEAEEWSLILNKEIPEEAEEQLAVQKGRKARWIPMERQTDFEPHEISYTDMISELEEKKEEILAQWSEKIRLPQPAIEKIPRHTVLKNWSDFVEALSAKPTDIPFAQHLKEFFESEFSTSSSVNGQNQLVLNGVYKSSNVCTILRRYVNMWKTCKQCKGTQTTLKKAGKVVKIHCLRCLADSFVDAA